MEREIVVVRYRRGLRLGFLEEVERDKVKVAVGKGRSFVVPADNVLLETGRTASTRSDVDAFSREVERVADGLDLREVWELVRGEPGTLGFRDIAELCYSATPDSVGYAAVLRHLSSEACPYFRAEGESWAPASEDDVEEHRRRTERQEARAREDEELLDWLGGGGGRAPESFSPRQRDWLDRVSSFVVHGDDWGQATRVKNFLSRLPRTGKAPRRAAFRLLVERGVFGPDEHLDLRRVSVPVDFDPGAEEEAEAFGSRISGLRRIRRDLTDLEAFSVDDERTTEIDDAFSVERTESGWRVGVHIADLSAAVVPGSRLDEAARSRVTTLYFPERKIPMLPPALSEGSGSLVEGEERLVLSLLADVDESLEVRGFEIVPATIVNRRRLTYDEVDRILDGQADPLAPAIRVLRRFAAERRRRRESAGAVSIERPELEIRVDESGIHVELRTGETPAQVLVSEMMILYNVEAAKFAREHGLPVIYRAQSAAAEPEEHSAHPALRRYRFFRSVPPPDLTLEPQPHRLLGVELYCQVTSPLRRFVDLLLQRQLSAFLVEGAARHDAEDVSRILFEAEERLRELRPLEPARDRYWLLRYLEPRVGEVFEGVLLDGDERRAVVELLDYPIRATATLHGSAAPGDVVSLRITTVDPWDGTIRLKQA